MSNFFGSLSRVIHTSIILSVLLFLFLSFGNGGFAIDQLFWSWLFRYFHVVAGVMWIGLLYFFNFIYGHVAATMDGDTKKKVVPELMPRTLYWFRWGAAWTWLTGVVLLYVIFWAGSLSMGESPGNNMFAADTEVTMWLPEPFSIKYVILAEPKSNMSYGRSKIQHASWILDRP